MRRLKELINTRKQEALYGKKFLDLAKISQDYKKKFNIVVNPADYQDKMSEEVGKAIADAYEALDHDPDNQVVKAAYRQLTKELIDQFAFLVENEPIVFEPYQGVGEPYSDSFSMVEDIYNYHMYFLKTESGFGEGNSGEDNIMLNKTGFKIGDYELVVNDLFRIVHDIFGHATFGYGFGPVGEDSAWFTHLKMFSPLAAAALTVETRGQNCWVNFGKHLRNNDGRLYPKGESGYLAPPDRPFAEQKMNIFPSSISGIEIYRKKNVITARYASAWHPFKNVLMNVA